MELSQCKAKMELEKRSLIQEQSEVARLRNELSIALSLLDNGQREQIKSKIPRP